MKKDRLGELPRATRGKKCTQRCPSSGCIYGARLISAWSPAVSARDAFSPTIAVGTDVMSWRFRPRSRRQWSMCLFRSGRRFPPRSWETQVAKVSTFREQLMRTTCSITRFPADPARCLHACRGLLGPGAVGKRIWHNVEKRVFFLQCRDTVFGLLCRDTVLAALFCVPQR